MPIEAAYIIRASCPPPMMPTVNGRALTRRSVPARRWSERELGEWSPQLEDHRALDGEVDGGRHTLRDHERHRLNDHAPQAEVGEPHVQNAEQPHLQSEGQCVERDHRDETSR